jgi:serine/threonine protein kinase
MNVPPSVLARICRQLKAKIKRPLGQGASKEAFLIKRGSGRYALKVATPSGGMVERFDRESRALTQCNHPNIAKLIESFAITEAGVTYWVGVEEYLPRGTLGERLAKGLMEPNKVRALGIALLGALEHMRGLNFVHRDIKPANILFRTGAVPVLTDFGIVRILGEPSVTHDFLMQGPGTPLFAAPEQLHNEKALIDWRTDQFDLALVLSMAALGRHPFQPVAGTQQDAIIAVANRERIAQHVQDELRALKLSGLSRAMEPWPIQRYAEPKDMLEALKRKE